MTADQDYREVNRAVWSYLATDARSESSQPYGAHEAAQAYALLDPWDWLPWDEVGRVLCLGAGGGQQGPLFASLGCEVTVVDLCPEQLELDRRAAAALGTTIECVEGDMQDLSILDDRTFDLVHQPVSTCYVPDVATVYRQVRGVLRAGGHYDVEHWNPIHTQLDGYGRWVGGGYPLRYPQIPGVPVPWFPADAADAPVCWHFVHHLGDLVGGLCRSGFRVLRVAERPEGDAEAQAGSGEHLAAFAPSFLRLLARVDEV